MMIIIIASGRVTACSTWLIRGTARSQSCQDEVCAIVCVHALHLHACSAAMVKRPCLYYAGSCTLRPRAAPMA